MWMVYTKCSVWQNRLSGMEVCGACGLQLFCQWHHFSSEHGLNWRVVVLRMSDHSLRTILHLDLNFHPFKLMMSQEFNLEHYTNSLNQCHQMLAQITLGALLFGGNKPHFQLSGVVIKTKFCCWVGNHFIIIHDKLLHSPSLIN